MKKLMIAVAVVLAGIAANAATIKWNVDYADLPGSDETTSIPMTGYYGFLIVNSVSGAGAESYTGPSYSLALAQAALADGDISFIDNYALTTAGGVAGTAFGETSAVSDALGSFANNTTVDAYLVILDAESTDKATKAFILDQSYDEDGIASNPTTSINGSGGSDAIAFGQAWYATEDAGAWKAVPEPTSGLLLLIGVAGLALRRRRA